MKRMSIIVLCYTVLYISNASAMISVDYDYTMAGDNTLTTPYSWAIVDNFDSGRPGWTYTGNGAIVSGAVTGLYAAPYNNALMGGPDATNYFTVPINNQVLSATVNFEQGIEDVAYNYLGLFWGSVDTYNTFEFMKDGVVVETFTGTQIIFPDPANGNQSAPYSNLYVNFYNVEAFDAVRFTSFSGYGGSSPFAFEFDNLAVGVIPAPGALLLSLIGLGVIRRFKSRRFV